MKVTLLVERHINCGQERKILEVAAEGMTWKNFYRIVKAVRRAIKLELNKIKWRI